MRTYERTHPWISFRIDLRRAPWHFWVMLGECQSKCQHIADVPLRVDTAMQLYKAYFAKGALASAAIEGNTLTEQEVRDHMDGKLQLPRSRAYQVQEVRNIMDAFYAIRNDLTDGGDLRLTRERIEELNRQVLKDVPVADSVIPGVYPDHVVGVGRYRGAPPEDRAFLLEKLCAWIEGETFASQREDSTIAFAIIKALMAHLYFEWIHPFGDGNGRTGRLIEFQILLRSGVPEPAAQLLSNHYNLTRSEYYRHLEASSKDEANVLSFLSYAVEGLRDGLREQLAHIRAQQWGLAWADFVNQHAEFRDRNSKVANRRRDLVLDLSRRDEPVSAGKIAELTPRVAKHYATVQSKTLLRDLAELARAGLIVKTDQGYRARTEAILAFRPLALERN